MTLFDFELPATQEDIHAASLRLVRENGGFNGPLQARSEAFDHAVDEITVARSALKFGGLDAPPERVIGGRP